jgi:biotin transport system ATP-binding protein
MEPDHLVLDEPFTGLDAFARESVLDRLDALSSEGRGVVVVTHDLHDVFALADRLVVLSDGRVVRDGPPEAVREGLGGLGVRPPC